MDRPPPPSQRAWLAVATVVVGVAIAGCGSSAASPEAVYNRYFGALTRYSADPIEDYQHIAYELLAQRSRQALERRAAALTAQLPPGVTIEPHQLLVSLGPVVSDPIDSIEVEQRGPSAATVVVEQAGQRHRVDLVREDGLWRIDLELPLDRI